MLLLPVERISRSACAPLARVLQCFVVAHRVSDRADVVGGTLREIGGAGPNLRIAQGLHSPHCAVCLGLPPA